MLSSEFGVADHDWAARSEAAVAEVAVLETDATVAGKHVVTDTDVLATVLGPDLEVESDRDKD